MVRISVTVLVLLISQTMLARLPDLIPYRKGNLWGYCDSTKKIIIEPQWEHSSPFVGATAVVKSKGFYGLIDRTGKPTTQFIYDTLEEDNRHGKRIAGSGNKKRNIGLIDEHGRVIIPFEYSCIYWESDRYLRAERGAVYGEIDSAGGIIVPFVYSTTKRHQSMVYNNNADSGLFIFSKGSGYKFGVVDAENRVVIPLQYAMMDGIGYGYFWALKHGKHGAPDTEFVFDKHGNPATWEDIPPRNYPCQYVADWWVDSLGNWLYHGWNDCSIPGKPVHRVELLYAGFFRHSRASFMNYDSLCGYVDDSFRIVIPAKYGWCSDFTGDSLAQVYKTRHQYPKKRNREAIRWDHFDVTHREPLGYIDVYGTEYWED